MIVSDTLQVVLHYVTVTLQVVLNYVTDILQVVLHYVTDTLFQFLTFAKYPELTITQIWSHDENGFMTGLGQGIQEWTKKILRKTAFKKLPVIWSA